MGQVQEAHAGKGVVELLEELGTCRRRLGEGEVDDRD